MAAQSTQMWYSSQNQRNFLPMNYVPLSVMMEFDTLKQWMMSRKNSMACSDLIAEIGRASIYLVNLSMVMSKWVYPPSAFLRGPTRSSPQTVKGHVMQII